METATVTEKSKSLLYTSILVVCLGLSGCLMHQARHMTNEQLEKAVILLETYDSQGCVCVSGRASPPALSLHGTVLGTIGGESLANCAQICIDFGR